MTPDRTWIAFAVDDEPPALKRLQSLFEQVEDIELARTFDSPAAAIEAMHEERPDLLFLDIQMPEISGFSLLSQLSDPLPLVVFVTAYDDYAVRAFDVNAADYLLKPVTRERFASAISRIRTRLQAPGSSHTLRGQVDDVIREIRQAAIAPTRPIPLKVKGRIHMVAAAAIDRVESDGNNLRIIAGNEVYEVRETLSAFEARLPADAFLRVNRSELINIDRIKRIEPWFNGELVLILADGHQAVTGVTYRQRVRERLGIG